MVRTTSTTITGHFAMSHTETASSLSPTTDPIACATDPESTIAAQMIATSTSRMSVTSSSTGRSFQIGRPSSTW